RRYERIGEYAGPVFTCALDVGFEAQDPFRTGLMIKTELAAADGAVEPRRIRIGEGKAARIRKAADVRRDAAVPCDVVTAVAPAVAEVAANVKAGPGVHGRGAWSRRRLWRGR